MLRLAKFTLAISAIWLAACAGNPMTVSTNQVVTAPTTDKAQIVFMRSSFLGSAINASLFEVKGDDNDFIGILANGTKVIHEVEPGEHLFMVVSEAADFMNANLEAGKTYYAMVTPRMGAWKARFSFQPIRNGQENQFNLQSKEFENWLNETKLMENSEQSRLWAQGNANSVNKKRTAYLSKWLTKDEAEKARQTLQPEDGR
ncbi:hypothetical protein [Microbulbifer discodermiae]|uniref:hypothetical protein n=1 Tax=Microbulbifer sp. 2201CG32-9 TaxID=3232309 RepID=UPI00345B579C